MFWKEMPQGNLQVPRTKSSASRYCFSGPSYDAIRSDTFGELVTTLETRIITVFIQKYARSMDSDRLLPLLMFASILGLNVSKRVSSLSIG